MCFHVVLVVFEFVDSVWCVSGSAFYSLEFSVWSSFFSGCSFCPLFFFCFWVSSHLSLDSSGSCCLCFFVSSSVVFYRGLVSCDVFHFGCGLWFKASEVSASVDPLCGGLLLPPVCLSFIFFCGFIHLVLCFSANHQLAPFLGASWWCVWCPLCVLWTGGLVQDLWSFSAVFSVPFVEIAELCIGDSCVLLSLFDVVVFSETFFPSCF